VPEQTRRFGAAKSQQLTKPADATPVWNVIMPAGTWHRDDFGDDGVMKVDRPFLEAMIANWKKIGSPGLPINYHHWGQSSDKSVRKEDKVAAGFIEDLRINASGDLEGLTNWNDEGRAAIQADKLRYFSPEWHENWFDNTTGEDQGPTLFGGAVLNDPYFQSMPRLAASRTAKKGNAMFDKKTLCSLFAMADDTSDDGLMARMKECADVYAKKAAAKDDGDGDDDTKKAALTAARDAADKFEKQLKTAQTQIDELKSANAKAEEARVATGTKALTTQLEQEGRITANEKSFIEEDVKAYGLEKATERWAKRPVVVPLGERGVNNANGLGSPEEAKKKLDELVDELVKKDASIKRSDARMRVLQANRELANLAEKLEHVAVEKRN
jgi:hypothetical protein